MANIHNATRKLGQKLAPNKKVIKSIPFEKIGNGLPENGYKEFWRRLRLECGHKIECKEPVVLFTGNEYPCYSCGLIEAKQQVAKNPELLKPTKDPFRHSDGRPKPKFRSIKKQEKFLKQVTARHNAVFEPGPHTIEDD